MGPTGWPPTIFNLSEDGDGDAFELAVWAEGSASAATVRNQAAAGSQPWAVSSKIILVSVSRSSSAIRSINSFSFT